MQRRAGQVRNGLLQGIQAVIQRQQGMATKSNDQRFFLDCQYCRTDVFWSHRLILHLRPLLPLGNRLRVDPLLLCQRPYARLTVLYCATDCLSRARAAV